MQLQCDVNHAAFDDVVDRSQPLETIAAGFAFIEGPVWHRDTGCLTFNDIPASLSYRWHPHSGKRVWREDTNKANGNTYDLDGNIIVCEHATSRLAQVNDDGSGYRILASHYQGLELNSPNDVIVSRDGTIWFTDPRFGRNPSRVGVERSQQLSFQGVYRLDPPNGCLTLVIEDLTNPNGLCFSPDESRFYVNDSPNDLIRVYDVGPDYRLERPRTFAITGGDGSGHPDGLKVDSQGNVYCAAQGGIHIYQPDGTLLGRVRTPVQAANFCFGDDDLKSIYVAASEYLFRFKVKIPGTNAGMGFSKPVQTADATGAHNL